MSAIRSILVVVLFLVGVCLFGGGGMLASGEHGTPQPLAGLAFSMMGLELSFATFLLTTPQSPRVLRKTFPQLVVVFSLLATVGAIVQLVFNVMYSESAHEAGANPRSYSIWLGGSALLGVINLWIYLKHVVPVLRSDGLMARR